jgi:hypothetical protein
LVKCTPAKRRFRCNLQARETRLLTHLFGAHELSTKTTMKLKIERIPTINLRNDSRHHHEEFN